MNSNLASAVQFTKDGIWIQPGGFWFAGTSHQLISIMISYPELDINKIQFRIRVYRDNIPTRPL
ncbi:hypothetical protein L0244_31725, partial [bacterium]|nr:hypothetical protein [bacterium]